MDRRKALGTLASLSAGGIARRAEAQLQETVTVGKLIGVSDCPFYIADKKGFFRNVGLNVIWTTFGQSQAMVAPLAQGQIDGLGASVSAGIYNAIGSGVQLKIVGDRGIDYAPYCSAPLLVRSELIKTGRYKTLKDLKGLKVVEPSRGGANTPIIYRFLQKAGLKYNDIEHTFLSFPDQVAGMRNGNVDASSIIEPFASMLVREGTATKVASDFEVYPYHQTSVLMFSGQFAQKRPDVARRFFVGYLRGLRYYHDALRDGKFAGRTSNDVINILQAEINLPDPSLWRSVSPSAVQTNGRVDEKSLQTDYDIYDELGLIVKPVNVHDAIDNSFADYANSQLGPYHPIH